MTDHAFHRRPVGGWIAFEFQDQIEGCREILKVMSAWRVIVAQQLLQLFSGSPPSVLMLSGSIRHFCASNKIYKRSE
jgi:hypothetical protein